MRFSRPLCGAGLCLALAAAQAQPGEPVQIYPPQGRIVAPNCPPQPCLPTPGVRIVPGTPVAPAPLPGGMTPAPGTPSPVAPPAPSTTPSAPTTPISPEPGSFAQAPERGGGGTGGFNPTMLGDILGIPAIAFAPRALGAPPASPSAAVAVPSTRGFKIAENESPRPLDRVYVNFNYFDDVNQALNLRLANGISNVQIYQEMFGLEKTLLDGDASIGFRLPLNTVSADATRPELGRTSTALGDLTIILKYALWRNDETGSLLSTGLTITPPTGPDKFAGSDVFTPPFHSTYFQPYVGYYWQRDRLYVHGFTALQVPTDDRETTLLTNDIGIGYFLMRRSSCEGFLTAIAPTFEVHVNTPLNHRGALDFSDPSGTPDFVNLTMGVVFGLGDRGQLALAYATPVTGPNLFNYQIMAQFTWFFGARGTSGVARTGPGLIGG